MNEVSTFALSQQLESLLRTISKNNLHQASHPGALTLFRFGLVRLQSDVTWITTTKVKKYLMHNM